MAGWQAIADGVFGLHDSCRVYAVRGLDGAWLVINAGTGAGAGQLPAPRGGGVTLLLTHHFRDHAAGAAEFCRRGAVLAAPWFERDHLAGEQRALRTKPVLHLYDLAWDHDAPVEPLEVDRWMMDYERTTLAGLEVEVVPTPGVTVGAASYVVTLPGGRRLAFIGELMCAPGRVARLSPLQYNYNDLTGLENVTLSWERVMAARPDLVLPSLGEPFADVAGAQAKWRENAERFEALQPGIKARLTQPSRVGLEEVLPRLYRADGAVAETHFVVSRSGRVLALDYGYDARGVRFPNRLESWTRRPLLHSVDELRARTGVGRIDTVIPTHYHDDHVAGVPLLQRVLGTEVWAGENFADLLERPRDFDRPCLWSEPVRVARRLPLGRRFQWEDVAITLHPMTGHTEFSTLLCLEIDGCRVAHTGDQLFFLDPASPQLVAPDRGGVFTNHVYRNGLALGGYADFVARLREFQPEWVLSGHFRPYRPDALGWARLEAAARTFDEAHRAIMVLEDDVAHFGADSVAAKIAPYQATVSAGGAAIPLGGWVLNPYNRPATADVRFAGPAGLEAAAVRVALEPRRRVAFTSTLMARAGCRSGRHLLTLDLTVDGRPFGQVAEAWVSVT